MLLALALLASSLLGTDGAGGVLDCRYARIGDAQSAAGPAGPLEAVLLPDTDIFRPILADQREPRFYADYLHVHFRSANAELLAEGKGPSINAAMVAFGGEFGLWGLRQRNACDGLQIGMFGVVFAQFNLDTHSMDLLNADYLVGPMLTYRHGPWSGRLRFYHQSSHLGDEYLLNYGLANGVRRQNLSVEIVDLLVSVENEWWRVFAGGGAILLSDNDSDLKSTPGLLQYGFELRGPAWRLRNSAVRAVFGAAFSQVQASDWSLNGSVEGGLEWSAPNTTNRIRALIIGQRGALPFSQFFSEKTDNIGFQLQFEH